MKVTNLSINKIYTDNCGRFRKIDAFFDGFNNERSVGYEKGYTLPNGTWHVFEKATCTKKTFAKWAKEKVLPKAIDATEPHKP